MISNVNTFSGHMVVRVIKLIYSGLLVPFQLQEYLTAAPGRPPRLQRSRSDSIALVFVALPVQLEFTHHTKNSCFEIYKGNQVNECFNKSIITLHYVACI